MILCPTGAWDGSVSCPGGQGTVLCPSISAEDGSACCPACPVVLCGFHGFTRGIQAFQRFIYIIVAMAVVYIRNII
jgi:hypothetical protein